VGVLSSWYYFLLGFEYVVDCGYGCCEVFCCEVFYGVDVVVEASGSLLELSEPAFYPVPLAEVAYSQPP